MTDNGLAALAAALERVAMRPSGLSIASYEEHAAAILDPRGVFLPDGHPLGVEEAIAQGQARIAALDARVVDLNAEVLDRMDQWHRDSLARDELARQQNGKIATLRAALEAARLELIQDVDPDAVIDAIDAALATAKEAGG